MSDMNPLMEKVRVVRWRMSNEKLRFSEELRIIPGWAYVLSIALFAGVEILAPHIIRRHSAHPMPLPAFVVVVVLVGLLLAALGLLIGYVNRDARRRGMNATLWTIMVILIPNAIGYILYFLVREPLVFNCPQCGGSVSARFNFCPKCKYNLHPACPECKNEVRTEDRYCPFCAHDLAGGGPEGQGPLSPVIPGTTV